MIRAELERAFSYDADSGDLRWKSRPVEDFVDARSQSSVNTRLAGKIAGTPHFQVDGSPQSLQVKFKQRGTTAHRIIWELMVGPLPKGKFIDHKNGNPFDNRLSNLRIATPAQNCMNRKKCASNTTGLKGVSRSRWGFKSSIMANGAPIHLGYHKTKGLAALAYAKASLRYHGQFSRLQ